MKLTKSKLQQIINEELEKVITDQRMLEEQIKYTEKRVKLGTTKGGRPRMGFEYTASFGGVSATGQPARDVYGAKRNAYLALMNKTAKPAAMPGVKPQKGAGTPASMPQAKPQKGSGTPAAGMSVDATGKPGSGRKAPAKAQSPSTARKSGEAMFNLQRLFSMDSQAKKRGKRASDYSAGTSLATSVYKDTPANKKAKVGDALAKMGFDVKKFAGGADPRMITKAPTAEPAAPAAKPAQAQGGDSYAGKSTREILALLRQNEPKVKKITDLPVNHPARVAFRKAFRARRRSRKK